MTVGAHHRQAIWVQGGVSAATVDDLLYAKIVPSFGLALAFGSFFYAGQAVLERRRTGRDDLCAQPFGVNTPGAFVFITSLVLPVFQQQLKLLPPDEAARASWETAVAANLLQGAFEVAFACVGPWLQKTVPLLALLTSLSSVGMAYLCERRAPTPRELAAAACSPHPKARSQPAARLTRARRVRRG